MRLGVLSKQPAEKRRVAFIYTEALSENDVLLSVEIKDITPEGLTVTSLEVNPSNTEIYFLVGGGVSGARHMITLSVTTLLGEEFEDELLVRVREVV